MNWDNNAHRIATTIIEHENDINAFIYELEGWPCLTCGGIITTPTTPSYVYKEKDICDCHADNI